jgi:hypothetical protein
MLGVVGIASLLAASGCGGAASQKVVTVSVHEGALSSPPALIATAHPNTYRGLGRVIPLSAVGSELPSRLPPNVHQPVGRGINRFVVIRLASGKTITYGPLRSPPAIVRLLGAMWAASRAGRWSVSPAEARAEAQSARASWLSELRRRAREAPSARFRNLPRAVFTARLRSLQRRYDFRVLAARTLHPVQDAPLVVVQTSNPQAFSRAVPAIQRLLDPKQRTSDDRPG